MIAIATNDSNAFQSNCFVILLTKNRLVITGKCFQIQLPEAITRSCSVKKVFLKISQYSQENACAGVSFNKAAGLKPPTHVFFCEHCKIFKNNFFIDQHSVTQQGDEGGCGADEDICSIGVSVLFC